MDEVSESLLIRLNREAAAWESWNAEYSDRPSKCCATSPPLLREAAKALELLAAQRRHNRAKAKSYKRRFREANDALRALLEGIEVAPVVEIDSSGDVVTLIAEGSGLDTAITSVRITALHGQRVRIIPEYDLQEIRVQNETPVDAGMRVSSVDKSPVVDSKNPPKPAP